LYKEALNYMPGGVNSPVRAFRSVDGDPLFISRGEGCNIWDEDGNKYIDFCCSWGPLILGHNNKDVRKKVIDTIESGMSFGAPTSLENDLAKLIVDHIEHIEKIRFVSSGTEAVMSAIRLARGYTNRSKIVKFEGCYHGHADSLLVKAGSGLATFGISSSSGVPDAFANETIILPLNNRETVKNAFSNYHDDIACIIIEPVPANNGLLLQDKEYLEFLRAICSENAALLIFDEVISGFRVGFEGAAKHYDIKPDICTYGKIIGGGLPVGAYASNNEIMSKISPDGNVYQAGTLSGNPVAMAAGIAQLMACSQPGFYEDLESKTELFTNIIRNHIRSNNYAAQIFSLASIFWISFSAQVKISAANEIEPSGMDLFKTFYSELLQKGVYLGPSGYEVGFVSAAHDDKSLQLAATAICECLDVVFTS